MTRSVKDSEPADPKPDPKPDEKPADQIVIVDATGAPTGVTFPLPRNNGAPMTPFRFRDPGGVLYEHVGNNQFRKV